MAKSIRSKSKRRFRSIKRENLYGDVERERTERLSEKQEALVAVVHTHPKTTAAQDGDSMQVEMAGKGKRGHGRPNEYSCLISPPRALYRSLSLSPLSFYSSSLNDQPPGR